MIATALSAPSMLLHRLETDTIETLEYMIVTLLAIQTTRALLKGSDTWSSVLMTLLSVLVAPAVFVILVLFGAPVTSVQLETALASVVISLLAVQPLLCEIGVDAAEWKKALTVDRPLSHSYCASIGSVTGAWLGAIPIGLDWDRPWQEWPITIVVGSLSGCILGEIFGFFTKGSGGTRTSDNGKSKPQSSKRRAIPSTSKKTK